MENTNLQTTEEVMKELREELRPYGERIFGMAQVLKNPNLPATAKEDRGEEAANLMLAYRHMEDCVMRLGKVIQAFNGGENPLMPKKD